MNTIRGSRVGLIPLLAAALLLAAWPDASPDAAEAEEALALALAPLPIRGEADRRLYRVNLLTGKFTPCGWFHPRDRIDVAIPPDQRIRWR